MLLEDLKLHDNLRAAVAEFDGVRQEVNDHLNETALVAVDLLEEVLVFCRHDWTNQLQALALCVVAHYLESVGDRFWQTEESFVELESVVFNLRQVQKVHHQVLHHRRVRLKDPNQRQLLLQLSFQ